jgi:predicted ATPase
VSSWGSSRVIATRYSHGLENPDEFVEALERTPLCMLWLKAGQQAIARSAMTEAVSQLRKGLDALARLPDSPSQRQKELDAARQSR